MSLPPYIQLAPEDCIEKEIFFKVENYRGVSGSDAARIGYAFLRLHNLNCPRGQLDFRRFDNEGVLRYVIWRSPEDCDRIQREKNRANDEEVLRQYPTKLDKITTNHSLEPKEIA